MRSKSLVICLVGVWISVLLLGSSGQAAAPTSARSYRAPVPRGHLSRQTRRRVRYGKKTDRRIEPRQVAKKLQRMVAEHRDLSLERIGHVGMDPLLKLHLPAKIDARRRRPLRVLIAAGVHGNEPSGVPALMAYLERALRDGGIRSRFDLTLLPMVNPAGLRAGTRHNAQGKDENRSFTAGKWSAASAAIRRSLKGEDFDLFVDLHGTFRHGHFLIRGSDDGSLSQRALRAIAGPRLLTAKSKGSPQVGPYALHTLGGATSNNPGTFKGHMLAQGVPLSYTLEYSRLLPPKQQVRDTLKLLRSLLDNAYAHAR